MGTFKENYHFPRFQGDLGGCGLFPIETHITCDLPGGPDPISLYLEVHIFFWISIIILRMNHDLANLRSLIWGNATSRKITKSNETSLEQLHFNTQICIISRSLCVWVCVGVCVCVHEPSLLEKKVTINFFSAQFIFTITVQVSSVDNLSSSLTKCSAENVCMCSLVSA